MKIHYLGKCFNQESEQYLVIGNLNEIIAVFFKDVSSKTVYRVHLLSSTHNEIKKIMELINNGNN